MKRYVFILLFAFICSLDASQEIQRIDSIVNDITVLRHTYKEKLMDAKEKNIILEQENRSAQRKIKNLENKIKELQTLLKNREKQVKKEIVVKEKIKKIVLQSTCKDENPFPKLKLKNSVTVKAQQHKEKLQHFKASAFRLKRSANIYAGSDTMQVLQKWDKHTSFTSNVKSATRIKITGYFIHKKWTKATCEMWVNLTDVEQK